MSLAGTPGNRPGSGVGADTGVRIGRGVRSLLHGQLQGTFRRDWIHLGARVLRRTRLTPYDGLGWEASAGVEVAAGAVVRLTVGRAPIGPSVYLPFRRAATVGLQLVPRRPRPAVAVAAALDRSAFAGATFAWTVEPSADLVGFRVRMPGAASVEIAGDFTDWQPVLLRSIGNGEWEVALPVPSGLRLLGIRVDGGPFQPPPGLETADDGFGGRAGVIFIERATGPG